MSTLPAIATSARRLQSCGFKEGSVAPSAAGTNRPPMKSLSFICMALEVDRIGLELSALVKLGKVEARVLPDEQHRPFGRIALVADVGGHRGHVACLHQDA